MSGHGANPVFLLKKAKIGCSKHSLPPSPSLLHPITSHFCLTLPLSLKVDVICVSLLSLKVAVWTLIRYGSFFIFFHQRDVLIYIFLPKEGANFRKGCIIEALRYTNSDTTLCSDVLFITLLYTIAISSDDEIDDHKSDGGISDENDLR